LIDEGKEGLRTALKFMPSEFGVDTVNGGFSFAYGIYWNQDKGYINGVEIKPSYNFNDTEGDFIRADVNIFKKFGDIIKVGGGISGFGNVEESFYDRDTAYGMNVYVDILDIFRATYVRRHGGQEDNDYFYLGIENIPSLFYWLYR